MTKSVLLSYLEQNKILNIPERKEENDVQYTKKEFLNMLNLMNNITVELFFQKFDKECDTYIDLEVMR